MKHGQKFDELIVGFIGETYEKRLVGKILTNCQPFVNIRLIHVATYCEHAANS